MNDNALLRRLKTEALIFEIFNYDQKKTEDWVNTYNPNLGATPLEMIKQGREKKLLKWIRNQLAENKRERTTCKNCLRRREGDK